MTYAEIHEKVSAVFRKVLDQPGLVIEDATTADDVDGWDSLTHVELIVAVERAFGVRFTTKEVKVLSNVGDLVRLVEKRAP